MLDVIHLSEVLLDVFGYMFLRDVDITRANGAIAISLGYNPRNTLENISDEVGRIIEKRFSNSKDRKNVSYSFRMSRCSSRKYGKS